MYRYIAMAALVGHMIACTENSTGAPSSTSTAEPDVWVEWVADQDLWKVRYEFSEPVKTVTFYNLGPLFRNQVFSVTSPNGLVVKKDNGVESISSSTPFKTLEIEHNSYVEEQEGSYEFHNKFSNRGVVAFVGYWDLYAVEKETGDLVTQPSLLFNFETSLKGTTILAGKKIVSPKKARWQNNQGQGTFLYFGDIQEQGIEYKAILDPTLPKWSADLFNDNFPKLFDFYTKNLFNLNFSPYIFYSYNSSVKDYQRGGGAIKGAGSMQINIAGPKILGDPNNTEPDWFLKLHTNTLFAHELAHLWNADSFDGEYPWLWEGGAEMLSYEALNRLNMIEEKFYINAMQQNVLLCHKSLKKYINSIGRLKDYDFGYGCGHFIGYISGLAIAQLGKGDDIYSLWRNIFSSTQNNKLTQKNYLDQLKKFGVNRSTISSIDKLLTGSIDSSVLNGEFFIETLKNLGKVWAKELVFDPAITAPAPPAQSNLPVASCQIFNPSNELVMCLQFLDVSRSELADLKKSCDDPASHQKFIATDCTARKKIPGVCQNSKDKQQYVFFQDTFDPAFAEDYCTNSLKLEWRG